MNALDASNPVIVVPICAEYVSPCQSPPYHVLDENGCLSPPAFAVCISVDFSVGTGVGDVSINLHKKLCQRGTTSVPV